MKFLNALNSITVTPAGCYGSPRESVPAGSAPGTKTFLVQNSEAFSF